MPYITDPNTGQQIWDGETVPASARDSIRNSITELNEDLTAITARVAALEALLTSLPDDNDNVYLGGTPSPDLDPSSVENVFVGARAGGVLATGNQNVGIGTEALERLLDGDSMIAIGESSLENIETGSYTIGIGDSACALGLAGAAMTDATRGIYIGWAAFSGGSGTATNEIVIGSGATGSGDNTTTIGTSSTTQTRLRGTLIVDGTSKTIQIGNSGGDQTIAYVSGIPIVAAAEGSLRLSTNGNLYVYKSATWREVALV